METRTVYKEVVITNVVIWCISNLVFVPIELYYAYQIYINQHSLVIAKRKPGILLISVIAAVVFYFAFQTIWLVLSSLGYSVYHHLPYILYYIILPIWYISWFTFICRLWLLYYTIRHSIATIKNKWQEQIARNTTTVDDHYIRYKHTLGTWNGLKKKILIYAAFTYIIDVIYGILSLYDQDDITAKWIRLSTLGVIKALSSTLIPMGFLIYMVYHIHHIQFADNIGLGRELNYCTYGYLLILLIRLVDYTVTQNATSDQREYEVTSEFAVSFDIFAWKLVGFVINLLQTRYPLKRFAQVMQGYSSRHIGLLAHAKTLKDVDSLNQSSLNTELKMSVVLVDKKGFDLFMGHCGAEHCTECVLCVVEMLQFKEEVYKKLTPDQQAENMSDEELERDIFTLPENCPQSDIVFDVNKNFKQIAMALYRKYIQVGSDWEINVDYFTRRRYNTLFGNEDEWMKNKAYNDNFKMYEVFDKCINDMTNLVRSAFSRFKKTETFLILQNKTGKMNTMRGSIPYDAEEEDKTPDS